MDKYKSGAAIPSFWLKREEQAMGKKDIYTKDYMEEESIFADAFNQFIYHGKQVIQANSLHSLDTTKVMYFIKHSKDKKKLIEIMEQDSAYQSMDIKAVRVVNAVTDIGIEMKETEERVNMCQGMKDLLEDARNEVREEAGKQLEAERKRAEEAEAELLKYKKLYGTI